jgi:hypothetical protein
MTAHVVCDTCHRTETWTPSAGGWAVAVHQPGGARRPSVLPQRARGLTALRAATGGPRVVGVCEACGQLLTTRDDGPPAVPVRIDTPDGPLQIDGAVISGPSGLTGAEMATAFLEQHFPTPREPLLPQIARSVFMMWLLGVLVIWLLAFSAVVALLSNLGSPAPAAITGERDWERHEAPADPPAP